MKQILIIIFALLIVQSLSCAQNRESKESYDEAKKLVLLVTGGDKGGQYMAIFKAYYGEDLPKELEDELIAGMEDLTNKMVAVYLKHYTSQEIKELVKFYETPLGKKVISTLPSITKESMEIGRVWGEEIGRKISAMMEDE